MNHRDAIMRANEFDRGGSAGKSNAKVLRPTTILSLSNYAT